MEQTSWQSRVTQAQGTQHIEQNCSHHKILYYKSTTHIWVRLLLVGGDLLSPAPVTLRMDVLVHNSDLILTYLTTCI